MTNNGRSIGSFIALTPTLGGEPTARRVFIDPSEIVAVEEYETAPLGHNLKQARENGHTFTRIYIIVNASSPTPGEDGKIRYCLEGEAADRFVAWIEKHAFKRF